jgi:hypothetical protein
VALETVFLACPSMLEGCNYIEEKALVGNEGFLPFFSLRAAIFFPRLSSQGMLS